MKKLIASLLAALMTFSLVGCASGPELLGKYETTFDMTESVVREFDASANLADLGLSLGDYMSDFRLKFYYEFKEDGTYAQSYNAAALDAALNNMQSALIPLLDDMMFETVKANVTAMGMTLETKDQIPELFGKDWQVLLVEMLGFTTAEMAETLMETTRSSFNMDEYLFSGKYKAEDGKLYLTTSMEEDFTENSYETYEIDGDTVTITGGVNIEEDEILPYPYTLTKIS